MSRTLRTIRTYGHPPGFFNGGDAKVRSHGAKNCNRKMKPYAAKPNVWKDQPSVAEYIYDGQLKRTSKAAKLLSKNVNRSIKKTARRVGKNEIRSQINDI